MNKTTKTKVFKNNLILDKVLKLNPFERKETVLELLKTQTARDLSEDLGVSETTIHDWKTLRNLKRCSADNIGLETIYNRIKKLEPSKIKDWGRLEMIKDKCEELLNFKK